MNVLYCKFSHLVQVLILFNLFHTTLTAVANGTEFNKAVISCQVMHSPALALI